MTCRVGMSTSPEERSRYWMNAEGHTQWQILVSGLTYYQAQARETQEAQARGCRHSGGGQYVSGNVWSVYHVWGGR